MIPPQNVSEAKHLGPAKVRLVALAIFILAVVLIGGLSAGKGQLPSGHKVDSLMVIGTPSRELYILVEDAEGELLAVDCEGAVMAPTGKLLGSASLRERWRKMMGKPSFCLK